VAVAKQSHGTETGEKEIEALYDQLIPGTT
jgi:hypothetical protein